MPSTGLLRPRKPPARRGLGRRLLAALVILALGAALVALGAWYLSVRRLDWALRHGLSLQSSAATPADLAAALDRWERETAAHWHDRLDTFLAYAFTHYSIEDVRVRRLLTHAAEVDFGERIDEWTRWYEARRRVRRGKSPEVANKEAVSLHPLWSAPVGLTAWFTTILPLDGQIYVASLGSAFEDANDAADGIVRVDARTGAAEILFQSPDRPPRDVIGLAAVDKRLIAACRNGMLYAVEPDGSVRWKASAGGRIASTPLIFDIPRSGPQAAVVTDAGKLVVVSAATGKTTWVADVPAAGVSGVPAAKRDALARPTLAAALALGPLLGDAPDILVGHLGGDLRILSAANGRPRWQQRGGDGAPGGAVVVGQRSAGQALALWADAEGRVGALLGDGRGVTPSWLAWLHAREGGGVFAGPRIVAGADSATPRGLFCTSGVYGRCGGSAALVSTQGLHWRVPVEGVVWGAPAVADVNGDSRPEVLITSFAAAFDGATVGWLTVLAEDGRLLRQQRFEAGLECPPVVADVNGDGLLEVLVADRAGMLHCLATRRSGPVEWGLAGGDIRNTRNARNAYSFSQLPCGMKWEWGPE